MIFPFELCRIKYLVDTTNILLKFETDQSICLKFIEMLNREIEFLRNNKFKENPLEPAYAEFNSIIDECIAAIEDRINLVRCGRISDKHISFDEEKYEKIVYRP